VLEPAQSGRRVGLFLKPARHGCGNQGRVRGASASSFSSVRSECKRPVNDFAKRNGVGDFVAPIIERRICAGWSWPSPSNGTRPETRSTQEGPPAGFPCEPTGQHVASNGLVERQASNQSTMLPCAALPKSGVLGFKRALHTSREASAGRFLDERHPGGERGFVRPPGFRGRRREFMPDEDSRRCRSPQGGRPRSRARVCRTRSPHFELCADDRVILFEELCRDASAEWR